MITSIFIIFLLIFTAFVIDYVQRSSFVKEKTEMMKTKDIKINTKARVKAHQEIMIEAPVEKVWDRLTSIKDWDKWQSAISSVKIDSAISKNISFKWSSNGISFNSIIHTNQKNESFGWIGTTWGAQAIHNWTFIKEESQTRVIVDESLEGLLISLFSNYFQDNLNKGMQLNLKELKDNCE